MIHELRITPAIFGRLRDGSKTFHVGDADKAFQFGDAIVAREFDETPINKTSLSVKGFTDSDPLTFSVGFVEIIGGGRVIVSLLPATLMITSPAPAPASSQKKRRARKD